MRRIFFVFFPVVVLLVLGALGPRAEAETGSKGDPKILSDSIVVTANRFGLEPERSVWPVSAVGQKSLAGQSSLVTALDGRAGADIRQSCGMGSLSTVSNWGMFNRHMLLLYDGRVVKDYSLGGFNLSEYSSDEFERVEFLKGPQSAFYGADAVGGVINLISRSTLVDRADIRAKYGTFRQRQIRIDLARSLGRSGFGIGGFAEYADSENARDNAGVERNLFGLKSDYLSSDGRHRVSVSGRYFSDSLGVPGPVPDKAFLPVYGNEEVNSLYDHQLDENYSGDLSYRFHDTAVGEFHIDMFWEKKNLDYRYKYQSFYPVAQDVCSRSVYNKRSSGINGRFMKTFSKVETALGVDWLSGSLRATATDEYSAPGSPDTYNFWSATQDQADLWSAVAYEPVKTLRLDVSGRLQFVKDRDSQKSYNIGAVCALVPGLQLKLGYGYAFRLPTLAEQFAEDVFTAGNVDLAPETSHSTNGTVAFSSPDDRLTASVTVFRQTVDSLVQYQSDTSIHAYKYVPKNVEEFKTLGIDLYMGLQAAENLRLGWSLVYQNAEQSVGSGGVFTDAFYVPEVKWRADVDGSLFERLKWNLNVTYTSDRGILMYGGVPKTIAKVYETGLSLSAAVNSNIRATLTGYDLTDEARPDQFGFMSTDGDYPSPGRRFLFEVSYSIW